METSAQPGDPVAATSEPVALSAESVTTIYKYESLPPRTNHRIALWLALLLGIGLAWVLMHERQRDQATWSQPFVNEQFGSGWRERWRLMTGSAEVHDGRIVTTGPEATQLLFTQKIVGDVAIEYTGRIEDHSLPCDLSLIYFRDLAFPKDAPPQPVGLQYWLQCGAYDGSYSALIVHEPGRHEHVSFSDFRPEVGKNYRFRVEVRGRRISLSVDGAEIMRHDDSTPFTGGYIALYGYYPGKSFTDVTLQHLALSQRVPVVAVAEALADAGQTAAATNLYARIAHDFPESQAADEATFQLGRLQLLHHDQEAANRTWSTITSHDWIWRVTLERAEMSAASGDDAACLAGLTTVLPLAGEPRSAALRLWNRWVARIRTLSQKQRLGPWMTLREQLFSQDVFTEYTAAEAYLLLGQAELILDRFPRQRRLGARALRELGRSEEIPDRFPEQRYTACQALLETGRSAEITARYPENRTYRLQGLIARGQAQQALTEGSLEAALALGRADEFTSSYDRHLRRNALMLLNRFDDVASEALDQPAIQVLAFAALGQGESAQAAAARTGTMSTAFTHWLEAFSALEALQKGDAAAAQKLVEARRWPEDFTNELTLRAVGFLMPAALALTGDRTPWERALAQIAAKPYVCEQHTAYAAKWFLGSIDDTAFLAQPHGRCAAADLTLWIAIRADLAGDTTSADQHYRTWLSLPTWERSTDNEPFTARWIAWRLSVFKQGH